MDDRMSRKWVRSMARRRWLLLRQTFRKEHLKPGISVASMYRIMFVLKRQSEDVAEFTWHWNLVDKVFKLFQWLFFTSIVAYAADKTRNFGLILITGILVFFIMLLSHRFYELYINKAIVLTLGLSWPKLINVLIPIITLFVLIMCYWAVGSIFNAFEYFQSHH